MTDSDMNDDAGCWQKWGAAAVDPAVDAALSELYRRLDADVAAGPGVCQLSGRCCHFEAYGHRLYVTALEAAWVVARLDEAGVDRLRAADLPDPAAATPGGAAGVAGCPFQREGICTIHALRPLGCRIFFCNPASAAWQNDLYEGFLCDLRRLHDRFGVPYRYLEWRAALAELRQAGLPERP